MSRHNPGESLPLRWQRTPDGRSRGTFTQFVRDHVADFPEGIGIEELIAAAAERRRAIFRLPGTPRGMREAILRLVRMGELAEEQGRLRPARSRTAAQRHKGR